MESKNVTRNMQRILQEFDSSAEISTQKAMEILDASESTVRRLFARLAQNGSALRTFGGIRRIDEAEEYNYDILVTRNSGAKKAIALQAIKLIKPKDVVFLDGGTTLYALASELARRIGTGEFPGIAIFTNSLSTLNALAGAEGVTLLGGRFRPKRQDFCGHLAENALKQLHFTKCFLGTDAIEPDRGFTTTDFDTARLNEEVIRVSCKSYVLADREKFDKSSLTPYAGPKEIKGIVTDTAISPDKKSLFQKAGFMFLS